MGMISEDRSCERCYGSGESEDASKCWYCRGTGRQLTELGRELIAFICEHFDMKPKADV